MKKTSILAVYAITSLIFYSCEEDLNEKSFDYVTLESSFEIGVDPEGTAEQDIRVFATSSSNSDRNFTINVIEEGTNAPSSAFTVPPTVVIPANSTVGSFKVTAIGENIDPAAGNTLALQISSDNSAYIGKPITLLLNHVCFDNEVIATFLFDNYPEEAYWLLYDNTTDTLLEGDGYSGDDCYIDLVSATKKFCLPAGEYKFYLGDCYGDGGTGFSLTFDGTTLSSTPKVSGGGEDFIFSVP